MWCRFCDAYLFVPETRWPGANTFGYKTNLLRDSWRRDFIFPYLPKPFNSLFIWKRRVTTFHGFKVHESDLLAQSSRTGEICNLTLCQRAFCFMLKPEKNGWKSCSSGILQSDNYLSVDKFIFRKPEVNNGGLFGVFCLFILVLHLSLNNIMYSLCFIIQEFHEAIYCWWLT